jgi:hypothetical protein
LQAFPVGFDFPPMFADVRIFRPIGHDWPRFYGQKVKAQVCSTEQGSWRRRVCQLLVDIVVNYAYAVGMEADRV